MAYQGISPYLYRNNLTNVQLLDDISASFNGTTTQFNLTTNGSPFHAVSARSLLIILGGIVQEPDADYTVNAGVITFTTAPLSGLTFAARNIYGLNRLTGINDGLVTPASLSLGGPEWDTSGNVTVDGNITQTGTTNNVYINTDTPTVRPTLDLNFERDQRLDSRITFSRNSTATYLGSDGLIKTALAGEPRFEFDTNGNCLGLLIEESRTNLITYSEHFGLGSTWNTVRSTVTTNQTTAPDGTITADLLEPIVTTSGGYTRFYHTVSSGTTYTFSFFAKYQSSDFPYIFVYAAYEAVSGSGRNVNYFNIQNGTLGTGSGSTYVSHSIEDYGNGWYRCIIVTTADVTGSVPFIIFPAEGDLDISYISDGVGGVYLWGAQLEAGSFATSYIPTSGSTVTRAVDEATITGTNFTDWYNASEGSIFAKYSAGTNVPESPFAITKTGSENADVIAIGSSSSGSISGVVPTIVVADGGVTQTGITVPITPVDGDVIRTAIGYKENDFVIYSATDTESGFSSDSSGTIPTVDIARIGKYPYYGIWQNRPIARILYYPERLSNTQLQNLTK